jgi:hypothetical protein
MNPAEIKIIVVCEFSQAVTAAFLKKGFDAYSCDLLPCEGPHPDKHIQGDAIKAITKNQWHFKIGFPPCNHIAVSGARWFPEKIKDGRQQRAINFFLQMAKLCDVIENPIGIMSTLYRKPDQIIQPWQFGHGERKATCLWLKNEIPLLKPTKIVKGRRPRIWSMSPSKDRGKLRSITYPGIAAAMADQWGLFLLKKNTR